MLKKILYSLLVFICAFIFIDKVSAANYTMPVTDYFLNYYDETHNLKNDLDNILDIAESKNYDVVIKLYHYPTNESGYYCNTLVNQGKCKYIAYYHILVIKNGYVPTFKINSSGSIYSSINSNIVGINVPVDSNYALTYNNLITALNNSDFSSFSVNFDASTGSGNQWYYQSSNNNQMIYGTSADYKITSLDSSSNTYYFAEQQIKAGSLLPTYTNYVKTHDEYSLSNITYSAIEVKFNIDDFPMVDEGNDINLEYEINLQNEMMIPLLPIPQERIYRNLAPEGYDLGTTVNLLFDEKANGYTYEGTKHYDYWNTVTYRFEFPFTGDYVGNINFKFWSDSNYTITLEERSNEENDIKYTELDLTGKYGVGFIPKVKSLELYKEFYGRFKVPMQNSYKLLFYKDYNFINENNKKNLLEDKVLLSLEQFEYLFTKDNQNSYLLFINNNFEEGTDSSIYYNSNYFNYCILDESISTCNIVNPNTDETIDINTNLSDVDSFGISNIFDTFLSFSNSTNFILENVTHFYNDYLPSELKALFYISFGFVVIIIITKIVL